MVITGGVAIGGLTLLALTSVLKYLRRKKTQEAAPLHHVPSAGRPPEHVVRPPTPPRDFRPDSVPHADVPPEQPQLPVVRVLENNPRPPSRSASVHQHLPPVINPPRPSSAPPAATVTPAQPPVRLPPVQPFAAPQPLDPYADVEDLSWLFQQQEPEAHPPAPAALLPISRPPSEASIQDACARASVDAESLLQTLLPSSRPVSAALTQGWNRLPMRHAFRSVSAGPILPNGALQQIIPPAVPDNLPILPLQEHADNSPVAAPVYEDIVIHENPHRAQSPVTIHIEELEEDLELGPLVAPPPSLASSLRVSPQPLPTPVQEVPVETPPPPVSPRIAGDNTLLPDHQVEWFQPIDGAQGDVLAAALQPVPSHSTSSSARSSPAAAAPISSPHLVLEDQDLSHHATEAHNGDTALSAEEPPENDLAALGNPPPPLPFPRPDAPVLEEEARSSESDASSAFSPPPHADLTLRNGGNGTPRGGAAAAYAHPDDMPEPAQAGSATEADEFDDLNIRDNALHDRYLAALEIDLADNLLAAYDDDALWNLSLAIAPQYEAIHAHVEIISNGLTDILVALATPQKQKYPQLHRIKKKEHASAVSIVLKEELRKNFNGYNFIHCILKDNGDTLLNWINLALKNGIAEATGNRVMQAIGKALTDIDLSSWDTTKWTARKLIKPALKLPETVSDETKDEALNFLIDLFAHLRTAKSPILALFQRHFNELRHAINTLRRTSPTYQTFATQSCTITLRQLDALLAELNGP